MGDEKILKMTRMVYLESLVMSGFVTAVVVATGFLLVREFLRNEHSWWFLAFLWVVACFPMVGLWRLTYRTRERWKMAIIRSVIDE